MNKIPLRLDLWTFTRFVGKTRFLDGFLGNEKFTNRVMQNVSNLSTKLYRTRKLYHQVVIFYNIVFFFVISHYEKMRKKYSFNFF